MSPDPFLESSPAAFATSPGSDFTGSLQEDAPAAARGQHHVPDAIERHYLRIEDRYFFPDRTLAFIDDGGRIRVKSENREVLHSVVAIAQARGWRVIELKGTEAFRQAMWREAALRGVEAQGYEPNQAEVLQVQRALKKWQPSHATGQAPGSAPPDREAQTAHEGPLPAGPGRNTADHPSDAPQDSRFLRDGPRPPVKGLLMAAAAAPYQFDPAQRMSFYVMVRTEVGDRTIWGADLERALVESVSQPRIGDQVVLTQSGTHAVKVRVPSRNAEGELIGEKKIVAQRARWSVETTDHLRAMERHAERVRSGEPLSDAALAQHQPLATAAAGLKLAEQFTRRVTADQASGQRLMQLIRERMADALEQGIPMHLPDRHPHPTPAHVRQRTDRGREKLSHERF